MKRKIVAILASVAAVIGFSILSAPAASAAGYGCSGNQIDSYSVKTSGGSQYATIYLYYDSSTGKNCAVTVSTSAGGYGSSKPMGAWLYVCTQTSPSGTCSTTTTQGDSGNYAYYAGPVSVYAAGHCILVDGSDQWNGVTAYGSSGGASHCG
ncbi:hypothetical protein AB0L59_01630 [Streptomyces sp. NPDC052109]|uniref:hypothetical protein n=1 Tax=Streptomyces sp. NPDC052109 TaxID=3155527 RepID=UPI0034416662